MTLLLSLANCGFHRAFAHVFDRSQSVADGPVAGVGDPDCLWLGRATGVNDAGYSFRRKFQSALIDIRRQNVDAHAFAFANEDRNLVGVVNLVAEQASHELNRVMRFQVSGLITDEPVSRAVALVKSVACKFLEQIEDGVRLFFRNFVRPRTTFDEVFSFLRHLLFVFFSHGAPEKIALRERVAGQFARGSHYLLLINHHAIGVGADFFQQRMLVSDFGQSFFSFDVVADEIHRAGAIKRDQRDDVVDLPHVELPGRARHSARFHLE